MSAPRRARRRGRRHNESETASRARREGGLLATVAALGAPPGLPWLRSPEMVKTSRGCLRAAARQSAEMARARLWPRMESMWDQAESRKARSSGVKDTAEGACDEITVIGRRAGDALDVRDSEPDRVVDDGGCGNPPREVQVVIAGDWQNPAASAGRRQLRCR